MAWGKKPRVKRTKVEWTDRSAGIPAPFAKELPSYIEPVAPSSEVIDRMVPGALFYANFALQPDGTKVEFPRLLAIPWLEKPMVKKGGFLIYVGSVRLEERNARDGKIITVLRHAFFAGEGRYIVTDFSLIAPA